MQPNEFRLGNIVYFVSEEHVVVVEGVSSRLRPDCGHFELSGISVPQKGIHIKPVPLTEEWLVRFGFEELTSIKWRKGNLVLTNFGHRIDWVVTDDFGVNLKYVHQLQNLYFALTGEELSAG
jgi:hypothetical protein